MSDRVIPELPPLKSLSGHDAYCRVCWEPVYRFWVSKEDHGGVCSFGASEAHKCRNAMNIARNNAIFAAIKDSAHDR